MTQQSVTFQAFKWEVDDGDEGVTIHIHGLTQENKRVTVKIPDFKPYVYLELDPKIKWTESKLELLRAFLRKSLHVNFPVRNKLIGRKKNYYYKQAQFLWMAFNNSAGIRALERAVRGNFTLYGVGNINLKVHEQRANPVLKLFAMRKVKPAGWICAKRTKKQNLLDEYCDVFSTADIEMVSSFSDVSAASDISHVCNPLIASYDIECVSGDQTGNTFPNPTRISDEIICISATVALLQDEESKWKTYALVNETKDKKCPAELEDEAEVRHFKNEKELLLGWSDFINEIDPDVIIGYNTLSFDDHYMCERANTRLCWPRFSKMGRLLGQRSKTEERKWSSSAYGDQVFNFIDIPGRLHIDMYPVIFKDFGSLMSYTLDYVSEYFLGDHKLDLPAKEMIQIWHRGEEEDIRKIVTYCNKDTYLPLKLMQKMNTWLGLTEMANVVMVPVFDLVTRGQQIRVFSQVYCLSFELGVVTTDHWADYHPTDAEKEFVGATVQNPLSGYWEKVPTFDFCLAGDTRVSLSNGTSKRIDELYDDYNVLGYNNLGFRDHSMVGGLQEKGEKDTVNLTLQYGKTITCTPDHKLLTSDGRWVKAQQLKDSEVTCGIEYPQDTSCPLEENWRLHIGDREFNLASNRAETLAFCRLVGYILADGSIYTSKNRDCVEIYLGTLFDAGSVHADLELLTSVTVTTRVRRGNNCQDSDRKGQTYCITLPANLAKLVHQIDGIVVGKRATQAMYLPKFIVDPACPLAVLREFLGGLFGGDGSVPSLSYNAFSMVSFKWTTIKKYLAEMRTLFEQLENLLSRFGVSCGKICLTKIKYTDQSIKPADYQENPRYDYLLKISKDSCYDFVSKIGFRYCINKAYKAYIVALYYNYCGIVRKQHKTVVDRANKLFRGSNDKSCRKSLEIAREEFLENNIPLHELVLSSVNDLNYMRGEEKRRTNHRISLRYKKNFPKPYDFLQDLGVQDWFIPGAYIMRHDSLVLPSFKQKIVDIASAGIQNVYDIQVDVCHNFIANGIVAHNCSLYPSTIIAHNLCFSTFVPEDEHPPAEQYHDLTWFEHLNCEHDTAVRKTKVKKNICREHHYRFYKAEIKKGIIPMLLENLLEARANTRKQQRQFIAQLKSEGLSDQEIKTLQLRVDVLEKRQLGYKVSANSVSGNTPIPCKVNGKFAYQTIEELATEWRDDDSGNQVAEPKDILVWSDAGWTPVRYVIRHPIKKPLWRVLTHTGAVDCTKEHSLLDANAIPVKPTELDVGDELLHCDLPVPEDTPKRPLYIALTMEKIVAHPLESDQESVAFSHGLSFAQCVESTHVPQYIFSAPYKVRLAFFLGYYAGIRQTGTGIIRVNNQIGAAGFCYLLKTLGYKVTILYSNNHYQLRCGQEYPTSAITAITIAPTIASTQEVEYIYDLETASHHFAAGVGNLIVHNSMYGGFGSDFSYTPFYPAAASTTAMGRKAIQDAIDFAKAYRPDTVVVYGDSVTGDTPVLLREPNGGVVVMQISLLAETQRWDEYGDFKPSFTEPISSSIEYHVAEDGGYALMAARHMFNSGTRWSKERKELHGWQVWTDSGWSDVRQIIRHQTSKQIFRVTTHTGAVDVTQDHSLLTSDGREVKPINVREGDRLLHSYPATLENNSNVKHFLSYSNKLDAANAWYDLKSRGYRVYLTSQNNRFLLYNDGKVRKPNQVTSVQRIGPANGYVYDLETDSGRFQAGVGELIVKNTDSCMLHFSKIKSLKECFEVSENLEKEINAIFPKPMYLELEKIYSKYFLLSKKRYVGYIVDKNGDLLTVDKKGVVIKRRDNCGYLRDIYSQLIDMVMAKEPQWKMYEYLRVKIDDLLNGNVELEKLVITKSIKDNYKAQNLPHVAVAKKMRERGKYVASGTRVQYIFTVTGNSKDPQYIKAEDPDHYLKNMDTVKIDYLYYFEKQLVNPIDEVLEVKFGIKDVLKNLLRLLKKGAVKNATQYFRPKFRIEN